MEKDTVEIKIKLLERIAEYYEFPMAVFFINDGFPVIEKTRIKSLERKAKLLDAIKELIEDDESEEICRQ